MRKSMMTREGLALTLMGLLVAGFASACEEESSDNGIVENQQTLTEKKVAEVVTSDGHTVTFWLYEGTTLARIESTAEGSSPVIEEALAKYENLADVYEAVAGDTLDVGAYEALMDFEERLADKKAALEEAVLEHGAPPAGSEELPELEAEREIETVDGIAVSKSAACAEPWGWDWSADSRWWGDVCSSVGSDYCKSMGTSYDTGWKDKTFFKAAGMNFSHCADATFQIWYHRTWFYWGWHSETSNITHHLVYPRYWTTWQSWRGDGEFKAKMWSNVSGNYVGLGAEWHN